MYGDDHEFTKLVVDLKGKDPDDAFSSIPYEKVHNIPYYHKYVVNTGRDFTFSTTSKS